LLTGPLISGATKTAILAALFVERGVTTIRNPYQKPDVTELLGFISSAGYSVKNDGGSIRISRSPKKVNAVNYEIMDDISTIMSYISLALYHDLKIRIRIKYPDKVKMGLQSEFSLLGKMGALFEWSENALIIPDNQVLRAVNIKVTSVGIYSDHQPFFALLLSKPSEPSEIIEMVWSNRFEYSEELNKLSESLVYATEQNKLKINPGSLIKSEQQLTASELRGAAVLLIAALGVPGKTNISGIEHLERGYFNFLDELRAIGAEIYSS